MVFLNLVSARMEEEDIENTITVVVEILKDYMDCIIDIKDIINMDIKDIEGIKDINGNINVISINTIIIIIIIIIREMNV